MRRRSSVLDVEVPDSPLPPIAFCWKLQSPDAPNAKDSNAGCRLVLSGLATNALIAVEAGATEAPYSITGVCISGLAEINVLAQNAKADPNEGDASTVAVNAEPGSHLSDRSEGDLFLWRPDRPVPYLTTTR